MISRTFRTGRPYSSSRARTSGICRPALARKCVAVVLRAHLSSPPSCGASGGPPRSIATIATMPCASRINPIRPSPRMAPPATPTHLRERLAERLDDDFLLAEQPSTTRPTLPPVVFDDDHRGGGGVGASQLMPNTAPRPHERHQPLTHLDHAGAPLHVCTCSGFGRSDSRTANVGRTKRSLPTRTAARRASPASAAAGSGTSCPGRVRCWMSIRPRSASMLRRTTSMPTPRPEISVTFSAVENPGWKISCWILPAAGRLAGRDQALGLALSRIRSVLSPAPSSVISMTMLPPWW